MLLRAASASSACIVEVAGRGRVVLARPDWLALSADGLIAVGPVSGARGRRARAARGGPDAAGPAAAAAAGFAGAHRTRRPGEGSELVDVRLFRPGDRLRRVDWRVSARRSPGLEELYVRRTHADADADVLLYVDTRVDVGTEAALWAVPPAGTPPARRYAGRASTSPSVRRLGGFRAAAARRPGRAGRSREPAGVVAPGVRPPPAARAAGPAGDDAVEPERAAVGPAARASAAGAVVVLLSPLLDDAVAGVALEAAHAGARVLCVDVLPDPVVPDPTVEYGARALALVLAEQAARRERLGAAGIPVLRWEPVAVPAPTWRAGPPGTARRCAGDTGRRWSAPGPVAGPGARIPLGLRADLDGTGARVPALAAPAVLVAGGLLTVLLMAGRPAGWPVLALARSTGLRLRAGLRAGRRPRPLPSAIQLGSGGWTRGPSYRARPVPDLARLRAGGRGPGGGPGRGRRAATGPAARWPSR